MSDINYSHIWNIKKFQKQIDAITKAYDKEEDNIKQNILNRRNNLLLLSGGLIAFIGIVQNNISPTSELSLKIGVLSLLITIIFAILVVILSTEFDIRLGKKRQNILHNTSKSIFELLGKAQKMRFDKTGAEQHAKILKIYGEDMQPQLSEKNWNIFFTLCTIIYTLALIVGMISLFIYYIRIIF